MITPRIKEVLESNGVRYFAKDFLLEGMSKDCVDAVHDAKLVYDLLHERMEIILGLAPKFPETQNTELQYK